MTSSRRSWLADLALDRGGLLTLLALGVYLALTPTFIVDGDNAEMSTLAATGGAAHPPGYPLYVLYLRAMSWLPGSSAAHTAALATAILGAASILVLHAACRAWGARPLGASIAVAIVAGAPVVLRLHTAAEVFALNDLIAALVLWLSATGGPLRGMRRVVLLAFVGGLGMSNQHTVVLLAPVGLLGAFRGMREASQRRAATVAIGAGALALGLAPYLYLVVAPHSAGSWGEVGSFSELLAHFTRADYGGVGAFGVADGDIDPVANVGALLHTLGRAWWWGPGLLGLVVLGYRSVRSGTGEPRWGWGMLAVSFVLAGPLLIARFNIAPMGIGLAICQRFHLFVVVLLTVPVAVGIDLVVRNVVVRRGLREALAVAVFAVSAGLSLPHLLSIHSPAMEKGVVNLLTSLPDRAVLITTSDDLHWGTIYAQEVLGIRRDVDAISWGLAALPWYRARFAARGIVIDPNRSAEGVPSVRVALQVFRANRALFVEVSLGAILTAFPSYPYGGVVRVFPHGTKLPSLDEIVAINEQLFATFDLAYPQPDPDAAYAALVHHRYALTWDSLARALAQAGRTEDAAAARALVRQLAPSL